MAIWAHKKIGMGEVKIHSVLLRDWLILRLLPFQLCCCGIDCFGLIFSLALGWHQKVKLSRESGFLLKLGIWRDDPSNMIIFYKLLKPMMPILYVLMVLTIIIFFGSDALQLVCSTWPPDHDPMFTFFLRASEANDAHLGCFDSNHIDNLFSSDVLPLVCSTWPP